MSLNVFNSIASINKTNKAVHTFKQVLIKKGLLNPNTGTMLVHGIDGEDRLFAKWKQVASTFIHKGKKVNVAMHFERMSFNESRVWPAIMLTTR